MRRPASPPPPRRLVHARHEGHVVEDGEREVRKGAKGSCAACMSAEALVSGSLSNGARHSLLSSMLSGSLLHRRVGVVDRWLSSMLSEVEFCC